MGSEFRGPRLPSSCLGPQFSHVYSDRLTQLTLKAPASSDSLVFCDGGWGRSGSRPRVRLP